MDLPFIVSTGEQEPNLETKRFVRSHVMIGKNRGRTITRLPKRRDAVTENSGATTNPSPRPKLTRHQSRPRQPFSRGNKEVRSTIPKKVGSELSLVQFADSVEPSTVAAILKFSAMAKKSLFLLETCIMFEKKGREWIEQLAIDPLYLHSMIFSTQAYFEWIAKDQADHPPQNHQASPHLIKTLELLRKRIMTGNDQVLSRPTISAILSLAFLAHVRGESASAKHHMEGLRKIVELRGGINTFRDQQSSKLLIEILRCDLTMALHEGSTPTFFSPLSMSFLPYPQKLLSTNTTKLELSWDIDMHLSQAWKAMSMFSAMINRAAQSKRRLPKELFLDTMASVMYRLLYMKFEPGSLDETLRIGLLAFSSHVFLQWQNLRMSYRHLADTFRDGLLNLDPHIVTDQPEIVVWLLMVGKASVLQASDDAWLRPWLRASIDSCQICSWEDMQKLLKTFIWIGLIQDKTGRDIVDTLCLAPALC